MNATTASLARPTGLQPLRVSVNASASLAGNVVHALCQAGLLVALTRLGEPAMVGQFAMGLAVTGPIMLLASLQLRSVQVTDASRRNDFSEYLALRLTTSAFALAVIAVAALVASESIAAAAVIMLVGLTKNVESVTDVYRGLMQQSERMERLAVSMILRGVGALLVFTVILALGGGLIGAVAGVVAVDLVVWWSWDVRNARLLARERAQPTSWSTWFGVAPRFDGAVLRTMARTALPLGLVAMLLSLNSYAPQYAVKEFGGDAELGIFAALLFAAMSTRVLIGAAGQSASPRLAKLYEAGADTSFRRLHGRLLLFGAAVGVAAIAAAALIGETALRIVYGAEYAARAGLFVELSVVSAILHMVSLQGYTVTATRCFRAQFPVSLIVAGTTLLTAFLLVPPYGVRGAAAAMLAGGLVQGAGYTVLLRQALRRMPQGSTAERAYAPA